MSMPVFPDVNPDITCESAINMILASIAMEELALSHIMNAEGEKLQYVLKRLESSCGEWEHGVDKLLAVNKNVSDMLDRVSQNQMLLKSKMEKALDALANVCPVRCEHGHGHHPHPHPCEHECKCRCKPRCSAVYYAKCVKWCCNAALKWGTAHHHGDCVCVDPQNPSAVSLCKQGRYSVSFAVNVRNAASGKHDIEIALQTADKKTLYTVNDTMPDTDAVHTVSLSGFPIEVLEQNIPYPLNLRLLSGPCAVESAYLSIAER